MLYAALSRELEGVSGLYLWDNRAAASHHCLRDREFRRRVWSAACDVVGVREELQDSDAPLLM